MMKHSKSYDFRNEPIDLTMSKREIEKRALMMKKHYEHLRNVKSSINTHDKDFLHRLDVHKKFVSIDRSKLIKQKQIRKLNEKLIGKITDIATKPSKHYRQEYPSKQRMFMTILAKHGRKMREKRITKENQLLAERLLTKPSNYDRKEWEKDWARHDDILTHLSRVNKLGVKIKTKPGSKMSSRPTTSKKFRSPSRRKSSGNSRKSSSLKRAGLNSLNAIRKSTLKKEAKKRGTRREIKETKEGKNVDSSSGEVKESKLDEEKSKEKNRKETDATDSSFTIETNSRPIEFKCTELVTWTDADKADTPQAWLTGVKNEGSRKLVKAKVTWEDQGSGKQTGALYLKLMREGKEIASLDLFGVAGHTKETMEKEHENHDVVSQAKDGDNYEIWRYVGGETGQQLKIHDLSVIIT